MEGAVRSGRLAAESLLAGRQVDQPVTSTLARIGRSVWSAVARRAG
jgi:hypothetical protein